jgi:crotonobetainyl-CoA:carnitine CoA-transferase CaiB-like acyl-CoA transferase
LGLAEDSRNRVRIAGREDLPSCFPVTDLAVASVGVAGLALTDLLAAAGERPGPVTVDRHLASAWFRYSLSPLGWSLPRPWNSIAGDYRTADGWIKLHTNAPHHRDAALRVLGCAGEREAVAAAVSAWAGEALEIAIVEAGGCAALMRSQTQWRTHPQGQAVMREPLIALTRVGGVAGRTWRPDPTRPLRGVRVLDLTRVLAGPVATRFLAGLGADVLRIDPLDWDEPGVVPDVTLGKRCTRLDLRDDEDRQRLEHLLANADILVHGYRPGALEGLDLGTARRRELNSGLIDISLCAWGWSGPWSGRRGFDSLVQMSSGIAEAGTGWKGADRPVPLPVQALDHATGYLMAAAALRGLTLRLRDQTAIVARLSLARTAVALVGSGGEPAGAPFSGTGEADYAEAIERTPWGAAQRLRPPMTVGEVVLHWLRPASELGSAPAEWM